MTVEYILYAAGYIACVLATLTGAVSLWLSRRHLPKTEPVIVSLAGFIALPCLIALLSPATIASPLRAFTAIGLAGAYLTARSLPRPWLRRGLRYGGIAIAVILLIEAIVFQTRPTFMANPNMTASWLLLCWPWMPWWLAVAGIVSTQSRAAIAGLALAGLALALQRSRLSRWVRIIILALTAVVTPWAAYLRWATVRDRIMTWMLGLRLFAAHPWVGLGPGASVLLGRDHWDSAPLTIAVEMGLVGLIAFAVLSAGLTRIAWRSRSPARWALLALAVQNMADDTWLWPATAILLGITLSLMEEDNDTLRLVPDNLRAAFHHFRLPFLRSAEELPEIENLVEPAITREAAPSAAGPASVLGCDVGEEARVYPGRISE